MKVIIGDKYEEIFSGTVNLKHRGITSTYWCAYVDAGASLMDEALDFAGESPDAVVSASYILDVVADSEREVSDEMREICRSAIDQGVDILIFYS